MGQPLLLRASKTKDDKDKFFCLIVIIVFGMKDRFVTVILGLGTLEKKRLSHLKLSKVEVRQPLPLRASKTKDDSDKRLSFSK